MSIPAQPIPGPLNFNAFVELNPDTTLSLHSTAFVMEYPGRCQYTGTVPIRVEVHVDLSFSISSSDSVAAGLYRNFNTMISDSRNYVYANNGNYTALHLQSVLVLQPNDFLSVVIASFQNVNTGNLSKFSLLITTA